jgi:5-methylthioadenosine/S-adenosylhomocysteine deaminase
MQIIQAGWVILPGMTPVRDHSLVFEDGSIIDILPHAEARSRYTAASVLERDDCVLSPGFVNAHMHLYGVLAHGIESPVSIDSFESFLGDYWWPLVEDLLDPQMIRAAAAYSAAELVSSGVTALCDVLEAPYAGYDGLLAEASVLGSLGIRALLSTEACQRISDTLGRELLEANARFIEDHADDPLIGGMLCTHTAFTCDEGFLQDAVKLAETLGTSLQLHLNESRFEPEWTLREYGMRTCLWYERIGLLSDRLLAAQVVQVDPQEITLLSEHRVRTAHVPLSNCEVGGGISPVPELLESSLCCTLGTDGYINNLFEVMRAAFLIHKGNRCDPAVMPSSIVYRMATEWGADALYPGSGYGRLQCGSPADCITISLKGLPTAVTPGNLFDQLILYRDPQHVRDVIVNGRVLKSEYCLQTTESLDALGARAAAEAQRLWEMGRSAAGESKE